MTYTERGAKPQWAHALTSSVAYSDSRCQPISVCVCVRALLCVYVYVHTVCARVCLYVCMLYVCVRARKR